MSKIVKDLKNIFEERHLPVSEKELENNQLLYTGSFRIDDARNIPFGLVIDGSEDKEIVDFQILYNRLDYLTNFGKKADLLEYLNELNSLQSGYYHFVLREDGEVYLRMLSRASVNDAKVIYELLILGGNIAQKLYPELQDFMKKLNG